jgi:hypothetical protein
MRRLALQAFSRRKGKARVLDLLRRARDGELHTRAIAMTAYRVRVARLAAGLEDDETVEAAAGALLEADTAAGIHGLHEMVRSYIEAMNRG